MTLPLSSSSHGLPFHEAFTTSSDSPEGKHLLRNSRSLYNNNGNYYSSSISLKNYSIKFESCHTVLSFKNDEDDEDRRRRKRRERRKTKRRTQQETETQETHEARKLSGDGDGDGSGDGSGSGDGDSGDGDSGSGDSGSGSGDGWDGTGGGVQYQRMVKFRLCPVNDCSNKSSNGCKSEYGEYVVDMATFLEAYVQDKQANLSTFCEATKYNSCSCNSDDNSYGGSSSCEISCFSSLGLDECVLYAQQQKYGSSGFSLDYFSGQCQYLNYKNGNNQNYNNNNYYDDDDEDGDSGSDSGSGDEDGDSGSGSGSGDGDRRKRDRELGWFSWFNDDNGALSSSYNSNSNYNSNSGSSSYNSNYNSYGYSSSNYYLGPYCSSDGKAIHMGLFKDSSCSVFADSYKGGGGYTYKVKTGSELPYNSNTTYSLVDKKCQNCVLESSSYNSGSSTISENTQTMYLKSAKCESSLYSTSYPNTDGCSYINGIAKLEKMQMGKSGGGSILYWFLIFFFVNTTFLMGSYAYFLRKKMAYIKSLRGYYRYF